jgi:hypothetical protein
MECPTCHRQVGFRMRSVGAAARFGSARVPVPHNKPEGLGRCEPEPKHAAPAYTPATQTVTVTYLDAAYEPITSAVLASGLAVEIPEGTRYVRISR